MRTDTPGETVSGPSGPRSYNPDPLPADRLRVRVIDRLPQHDTIWDLRVHPDDTLYIGACMERTSGGTAWLCSYRSDTDDTELLADLGVVTGEGPETGRPTHGKIHFSLCCDPEGIVYGATHCTTAPAGDPGWSPLTNYTDSIRSYPGAHLFRHDPSTKETRTLGVLTPREGIRVMVLDARRNILHGTTYPKNHYFIYDLNKNELTDLGRIGFLHQLAIVLDAEGNGYTTDSWGRFIRCKADSFELEYTGAQMPCSFTNGEHNYFWQAVLQPETGTIYGAGHQETTILFRYDTRSNEVENLGPSYGYVDTSAYGSLAYPVNGLVFSPDGFLYYVAMELPGLGGSARRNHLIRYDTATHEQTDLGVIQVGDTTFADISSHAQADSKGNLYIADSHASPPRFFVYLAEGAR